MSVKLYLVLASLGLLLSGCAAINPYASEFSCPPGHPGACVSVDSAYRDSLTSATNKAPSTAIDPVEQTRQRQLAALVNQPDPPLLAPPRIVRLLVLPYTGADNVLYLQRHLYLVVDQPRWLLSGHREGERP